MNRDGEQRPSRFMASRREDLLELAALTEHHVQGRARCLLLDRVLEQHLMAPQGALGIGLRILDLADALLKPLRRLRGVEQRPRRILMLIRMQDMDNQAFNILFNQTIRHMVNGRDSVDADSVGGWSQEELDQFVAIVMPMLPDAFQGKTAA